MILSLNYLLLLGFPLGHSCDTLDYEAKEVGPLFYWDNLYWSFGD